MAEDFADPEVEQDGPPLPRRRRWRRWFAALGLLLFLALTLAWCSRERIAENIISGQVDSLGLPARYKVESIGLDKQVISNIVVGDPGNPDLTIERIEADVVSWWGVPSLGRITLVRPRLHGSYRGGKLSFGSLDKLLFAGPSNQPFRFPDYDVKVIDGRGAVDTDFGPVGLKLEGEGKMRGGFSGIAAAIAPQFEADGCTGERASLYGDVKTSGERLTFSGPMRLAGLACPATGTRLGASGVQIEAIFDPAFDGAEGKLSLAAGQLVAGAQRVRKTGGEVQFTFRKRALTASFDLGLDGYEGPQARLATLQAKGAVRTQDMFERMQSDGSLSATGLRTGNGFDAALASVQRGAAGTLGEALAGKLRAGLAREQARTAFSGNFLLRKNGLTTTLTVPQAALRGTSGQALLAVSRLQIEKTGSGAPVIDGAFASGGIDLPRLAGRFQTNASGGYTAQFALAEYAAGTSRVSMPEMMLVQLGDGSMGFAGTARLSGVLPGGEVRNLALPVKGTRTPAGALAVWRECTPVGFDSLSIAGLVLDRRSLTLCPQPGGAIFASDARGTRFAAGVPSLALSGRLDGTPVRLSSGPVGFAWPGKAVARAVEFDLGGADAPSRFRIADLTAEFGADIGGTFAGTDVFLDGVPLNVLAAGGMWRFDKGRLDISDALFRIEDREVDDRFQPLSGQGATMSLENGRITAEAVMRDPKSQREVVRVTLAHDLESSRGSADLAVPGIVFDKGLQPDELSHLLQGVVANVQGTVRGQGRIAWDERGTTSSGTFSTDKLDFAAAFGPVEGVSGTVEFTDLLGLVTAPHQKLRIAGVNPGIEVNDGELLFAMQPENVLQIEGARWPFLDGTLTLEPTSMVIGKAEVRRFTLRIDGLDAAKFVQHMELSNLAATGTFDGSLPLMFDQDGGHILKGALVSRAPGGNVSYVGALTYKDMSTMANFAFDALKSIDYRTMRIDMDGPLDGEIVTRVSFEGLSQGQTARRNFITRQISKLPIRFNVNLRAPFFKLVNSVRSIFDPAYVADPRTLGIVGANGKPASAPSGVQHSESGRVP